jgi:hypothetical protein
MLTKSQAAARCGKKRPRGRELDGLDLQEAFLAGVKWTERWIHVDDALPALDADVLVRQIDSRTKKETMAVYRRTSFGWSSDTDTSNDIIRHWRYISFE